jgi:hypothetical protein
LTATRPRALPAALLRAAAGRHDLLRVHELQAAGLSHRRVGALVRARILHRVHRGVYKVGTPVLSPDARLLAAVYAGGPVAVISHRDAAVLHGLPVRRDAGTVSVTTNRGRADRPGLTLHRVRRLHPDDVTSIRGIPVTTLARTVLDLADVLSSSQARLMIHEAEVLGMGVEALEAARRRAPGRDTRVIAGALEDRRPHAPREIEERLEAIAARAGLAEPRRNCIVHVDGEPFELDRLYPDLAVCLEADGWQVHSTHRKFNSDRRRDRILWVRGGIRVLPYTWDDVTVRAAETKAELARLLHPPTGRSPPAA